MASEKRRRNVLCPLLGRLARTAACLAALLAGGCGVGAGQIPDTQFFVIDYSVPPASPAPARALPVTVGVENFRADAVYRTDRIVYRKVPNRVDFYPYERWGARPDEFVTDRLLDHLLASRRFQEVVRASGGAAYDYLVRGRVKRFEEVGASNGTFSALVQVELWVVERRTGKVLLQRQLSQSAAARSKPPQGFVAAMAEGLRQLLAGATEEIAGAIARHAEGARP